MVRVNMPACDLILDGYLHQRLTLLKQLPPNDWDVVGLCSGYEGGGKTTLFMQLAYFFDPSFNIDKIVFNIDQFNEAVDNAAPGSCILYDEADDATVGANWQKTKVKAITSKMKRIRKQRLYILFVTPTLFDIGKYFAIHRARFLIHVYSKGLTRGYFRFYDRDDKRKLYINGKREWDMDVQKSTFHGRFGKLPDGFPVSMDAYEAKKDAATAQIGKEEEDNVTAERNRLAEVLMSIPNGTALTEKLKQTIMGLSRDGWYKKRAKTLENDGIGLPAEFLVNHSSTVGGEKNE